MIGTLMPACLLLAVAQVAAPTPPPGACDVGMLPTKLEVVELACCSQALQYVHWDAPQF
eukprot:COSAG03_NODE_1021_length_5006_cov_4.673935_7_plen_59_part_00